MFDQTIKCSMFALTLFLLAAATPAAWGQAGSFELGINGGLIEFDDNVGGEREFRFDVRGGYFFNDHFQLEGQAIRATSIFDLDLEVFMVNAVFHFGGNERFTPYALVGAGIANLEFSQGFFRRSVDDSGTALQAALGARFYVGNGGNSIRIEVSALNEETFDDDATNISLTGGFSWRFGG